MTAIEQDVREVKTMVSVLLKRYRPTIGIAELKELLEVDTNRAAYSWIKRNGITSTTKGRYLRLPVYEALQHQPTKSA